MLTRDSQFLFPHGRLIISLGSYAPYHRSIVLVTPTPSREQGPTYVTWDRCLLGKLVISKQLANRYLVLDLEARP
jgi:hypothetical protein